MFSCIIINIRKFKGMYCIYYLFENNKPWTLQIHNNTIKNIKSFIRDTYSLKRKHITNLYTIDLTESHKLHIIIYNSHILKNNNEYKWYDQWYLFDENELSANLSNIFNGWYCPLEEKLVDFNFDTLQKTIKIGENNIKTRDIIEIISMNEKII